jgi:hypothetical protein
MNFNEIVIVAFQYLFVFVVLGFMAVVAIDLFVRLLVFTAIVASVSQLFEVKAKPDDDVIAL